MKRTVLVLTLVLLAAIVAGCAPEAQQVVSTATRPVHTTDLRLVKGQTVYVPAYSEIFADNDRVLRLTVTLAIHNSDPDHAIVLRAVRYYDTNGTLVTNYLEDPVEVGPMATAGYVVEKEDVRGGWGANFVVEWGAEQQVYEPVIEAVMIGADFGHVVSLTSPGRVVSQAITADD